MTKRKTALDFFSGCGGLSYGLQNAGFEIIGAVEIDELAAATYRMNFPDTMLFQEDINHVEPEYMQKSPV